MAQLVGQGALAVVLLAKRVWKEFPIFTGYVVFELLDGITKYVVYKYYLPGSPKPYFFVFWIGESVAVVLGLAVFYEVFRYLFSVHSALRRIANVSFIITIIILLSLGGSVFFGHSTVFQSLSSAVFIAEEAARILEVGLLVFLFLFAGAFGLHWRQPVFGICMGLGIFTAVELINLLARSRLGAGATSLLSLVRMLAYTSSLLVWIGYLLAPERTTSAAEIPSRSQLEQWNEAIMELIHQ